MAERTPRNLFPQVEGEKEKNNEREEIISELKVAVIHPGSLQAPQARGFLTRPRMREVPKDVPFIQHVAEDDREAFLAERLDKGLVERVVRDSYSGHFRFNEPMPETTFGDLETAEYPEEICPALRADLLNYEVYGRLADVEEVIAIYSPRRKGQLWLQVTLQSERQGEPPVQHTIDLRIDVEMMGWFEEDPHTGEKYRGYQYKFGDSSIPLDDPETRKRISLVSRKSRLALEKPTVYEDEVRDEEYHPGMPLLEVKGRSDKFRVELLSKFDNYVRALSFTEQFSHVETVVQAVRKLSVRVGRDRVRDDLTVLRRIYSKYLFDEIDDHVHLFESGEVGVYRSDVSEKILEKIIEEIHEIGRIDILEELSAYAFATEDLNSRFKKQYPEPNCILMGLHALFEIEKAGLECVSKYPWNEVGPEPFDSLINVVWFRFDYFLLGMKRDRYVYLSNNRDPKVVERGLSDEQKRMAYGRAFKRAVSEYLLEGTDDLFPDWDKLERKPSEVYQEIKSPEKRKEILAMSRRHFYSDMKDTAHSHSREALIALARPWPITELLYATLRREGQASKWRPPPVSRALWYIENPEELIVGHSEYADESGRIVLAGEGRDPGAMSHELTAGSDLGELEVTAMRALDQFGPYTSRDIDILNLLGNDASEEKDRYFSVRDEFLNVVGNVRLNVILKEAEALSEKLHDLLLHRLGFAQGRTENTLPGSVDSYIKRYYEGRKHKYYKDVQKITEYLRDRLVNP